MAKRIWFARSIAAAGALALAGLFAWPWESGRYLAHFEHRELARILQVELVVAGGGLFLIGAAFIPTRGRRSRWLGRFVFAGFASILAIASFDYGGWRGVMSYVVLVYVTFGTAILAAGVGQVRRTELVFECAARIVVPIAVLFACVEAFGVAGGGDISLWVERDGVVAAGAVFFPVLAVLELTAYPVAASLGRFAAAA